MGLGEQSCADLAVCNESASSHEDALHIETNWAKHSFTSQQSHGCCHFDSCTMLPVMVLMDV
jgi:hypothetical protein